MRVLRGAQGGAGGEFDFVVVGGGSAGACVAARLAECGAVSVALVEAGGFAGELDARIPLACGKMQNSTRDWMYFTEDERPAAFKGISGGKSFWPRGRVVGGSSVLNYMAAVRGAREDFDTWAAQGAAGWSWAEVEPLFKKSEDMLSLGHPDALVDAKSHGTGGPLGISIAQDPNPVAKAFVQGCTEVGFSQGDYNNGDMNLKASLMQQTIRQGQRDDTGRAFLTSQSPRPNLTVITYSQATRVLFAAAGAPRAVGIEAVELDDAGKPRGGGKGTPFAVRARMEVVLCCGAIGSPHLLLLSGVGPREQLERAGVAVVLDAPKVGQDLEDHIANLIMFRPKQADIGAINQHKAEGLPHALLNLARWATTGSGILATPAYDATAFYKSAAFHRSHPGFGPDLQIGLFAAPGDPAVFQNNIRFTKEHDYLAEHYQPTSQGFMMVPTLLHLHSRGSVELKSSDPLQHPRIRSGFLSDPRDVRSCVEMYLKCFEIAKSPTMAKIAGEPVFPQAMLDRHAGDYTSPAFLEDFARHYANTLYHPTSTCKIGAVVDERLNVLGISGLRVADAAVMPCVISGNTNLPSVMIGEKAAMMIKQDHKLSETAIAAAPERTPAAPFIIGAALGLAFLGLKARL
jgi:choline dehydrogenase